LIYIYNIVSGYVKSYSINDGGLELTINVFKPYSFFPITETLAKKTNTYYFEAVTDVVLQKAPTQKVHEFVKSDPEILFDLVRRVSVGLEGFMLRTQYLVRSNSTQKVASTFVLLARRFGETDKDQKVKILLPQTHADIANLAGVSRETASIEVKKLVDEGLVSVEKQVYTVEDFEKLRDLSTLYYEDRPLPYSF
jgi:CRP/FNR family transcriptional regulator